MRFEELIAPLEPECFFEEHWNLRPLLVKRERKDFYDGLVAQGSFESLLIQGRLRYPEVRLVMRGKKIPFDSMFHAGWLCGVQGADERSANVPFVYDAYREGYTVVIRAEKVSPPIAALCRWVEERLHHPVIGELFLTPKDSQGSLIHCDPHDVFVLQLSGAKHWRVYDPPTDPADPADLAAKVGAPIVDTILEPGDLLYVPRGLPHEALTEPGKSSFHLSMGIYPLRWLDLMTQALQDLGSRDPQFQEALPVAFLHADAQSVSDKVRHLCKRFLNLADGAAAFSHFSGKFCSGLQPLAEKQFAQIDELDQMTLDSLVTRRPGMLCHLTKSADAAILSFPGSRLTLPLAAFRTLGRIVAMDTSFSARTLRGSLDEDSRLRLIVKLIRAGFLQLAGSSSPRVETPEVESFALR